MPVTFSPAPHAATSRDVYPRTSPQILESACPNQFKQVKEIMQSSIGGQPHSPGTTFKIVPNTNGFVNTVLSAWGQHHALVLRPDDVWLAIIAQFSFYVNANAELLRANFVSHSDKKELLVEGLPDYAHLSRLMADKIHENVVDPALCAWILPDFSTTTMLDRTVGSMLMMATMKKYFDYKFGIVCGFPRVTLEGEKRDWVQLLERLEKLREYGLQTIAWYHLLLPVMTRFVMAFDAPNSAENLKFWRNVACDEEVLCGSHTWSGWITAFCVFSDKGKWQGPWLDTTHPQTQSPESMSSRRFWSSFTRPLQETRHHLVLEGEGYAARTEYPIIEMDAVPPGYAEVDVTIALDDNEYAIIAGLVGMGFSSSRDVSLSPTGKNDTVRPVLGWWMYSKKKQDEDNGATSEHPPLVFPIYAPMPPPTGVYIPPLESSIPLLKIPSNSSMGSFDQQSGGSRVPIPPPSAHFPGGKPSSRVASGHARRRSESVARHEVTQNQNAEEYPVRKRRMSFIKKLFKF
ncbi:hypothetical protein R3P38DRAFT_494730 [Favolaschia claudopus]|uniref:Uncharacterized protein n=1 Tax=Favolaschia claudopus TaxID=2862362 RepID=A0AAW0CLZ5_9AGAR